MRSALERAWYRPKSWSRLLLPLSWLFRKLSDRRRRQSLAQNPESFTAPVVIVGNISVGGTGKTPLLLSVIRYFLEQGYKPGVISRGYGGQCAKYPCQVTPQSSAAEVGDEPLLYAGLCPVVVDPDRAQAARYLLDNNECNVVFSDDGLQHYNLHRDVEIVVVDGQRGFGNGLCLPAGPLRESPARIDSVDLVVVNGKKSDQLAINHPNLFTMAIRPRHFRNIALNTLVDSAEWVDQSNAHQASVHAVAGIGNPQRFVDTLQLLGLKPELHAYSDHHQFSGDEFRFSDQRPVIITAKDAVKCRQIDNDKVWVLDVDADLPLTFYQRLEQLVEASRK